MEIGALVGTPGGQRLAHQPTGAKEEAQAAAPGGHLPQRAVAAQVAQGLAQGVGDEEEGDAPEPLQAPGGITAQGLVQVEGHALVLGFLAGVPKPQRRHARVLIAQGLGVT